MVQNAMMCAAATVGAAATEAVDPFLHAITEAVPTGHYDVFYVNMKLECWVPEDLCYNLVKSASVMTKFIGLPSNTTPSLLAVTEKRDNQPFNVEIQLPHLHKGMTIDICNVKYDGSGFTKCLIKNATSFKDGEMAIRCLLVLLHIADGRKVDDDINSIPVKLKRCDSLICISIIDDVKPIDFDIFLQAMRTMSNCPVTVVQSHGGKSQHFTVQFSTMACPVHDVAKPAKVRFNFSGQRLIIAGANTAEELGCIARLAHSIRQQYNRQVGTTPNLSFSRRPIAGETSLSHLP